MRKASKIMLIVGMAMSFACAVSLAVCSLVFSLIALIPNGSVGDDEIIVLVTLAICFGVIAVFCFLSGLFTIPTLKNQTHKKYIVAIVFSSIATMYVTIAGCVLGMIVLNKANKVIEVKAK